MTETQEQETDEGGAWKQRRKFLLVYYNTLSLFSVLAVFGLLVGIACDCMLFSLLFVLLFFVSLVQARFGVIIYASLAITVIHSLYSLLVTVCLLSSFNSSAATTVMVLSAFSG